MTHVTSPINDLADYCEYLPDGSRQPCYGQASFVLVRPRALWVEYRDKRGWRVAVEGPPAAVLTTTDVEQRFGRLAGAPAGPGWQLMGVSLNDRGLTPDPDT